VQNVTCWRMWVDVFCLWPNPWLSDVSSPASVLGELESLALLGLLAPTEVQDFHFKNFCSNTRLLEIIYSCSNKVVNKCWRQRTVHINWSSHLHTSLRFTRWCLYQSLQDGYGNPWNSIAGEWSPKPHALAVPQNRTKHVVPSSSLLPPASGVCQTKT